MRRWGLPALVVTVAVVAAPLLLLWPNWQVSDPVSVGHPAPRTVIAPVTVQLPDDDATDEARREAADAVGPVLRFDDEARNTTMERIDALFDAAADVRAPVAPEARTAPAPDATEPVPAPSPRPPGADVQVDALTSRFGYLTDEAATAIVRLSDRQLEDLRAQTTAIAQQLMREQVTGDELPGMLDTVLATEVPIRPFPDGTGTTVAAPVLDALVQPTVVEDVDATEQARRRAADAVAPVTRTFTAGSPIVTAGEPVDELQQAALEQLNLAGDRRTTLALRAVIGWAAALAAGVALLAAFDAPLLSSRRRVAALAAMSLLLAGAVAMAAAATAAAQSWWMAAPVAVPAAMATLLTSRAVAAAALLPAAAVAPLVIDTSASGPAVFAVLSVAVAAWAVHAVDSRRQLRRSMLWLPPALALAAAAASGVWAADVPAAAAAVAAAAGGAVSAFAVLGLLPFAEGMLGLPTVTALADLTDRNHPLLRRLEKQAPGTYNHSIAVATLVETACRTIGANPLLGQVAALYHDIGKTERPQFFIENQKGVNPHDDLDPWASAKVLHDHVSDGIALADDHQLPPEVIDAIRSHHGTTLVAYFFARAQEIDVDVDESAFRYPQVEPRSKEATILLIADGCEAAVRSAAQATGTLPPEDIAHIVQGIVDARTADAQMVRSQLTFADLEAVRDAIVDALVNIYHPRINYPSQPRR